jgi:hypothetical protein
MGTRAYTDPNNNIRREINTPNIAGVAGASMQKFLMFQKTRLKKVHCLVVTAGTNAAAQVDIFNGTASVGSIVVGTNTAGTVLHSAAIDSDIPANGQIELKGAANTATFVGVFSIENEVAFDADQS